MLRINIKKLITLIFILTITAALSLGFASGTDLKSITSIEEETDKDSLLVCIDPGHGGTDNGSAGPTGLLEKDINLDIAVRIKNKLLNEGIGAILTRSDDSFVSDEDRVRIAIESSAVIFISIHNDGNDIPGKSGTEIFYCEDSPAVSRNLAVFLNEELVKALEIPGCGTNKGNFQILNNICMVSAHVNSMFISNPGDESKLKQREYRDLIAEAVKNGLVKFISEYDLSSYKAVIDDLGNTPDVFFTGETRPIDILLVNNSGSFTWPSSGENRVSLSYNIYNRHNEVAIFDGNRAVLADAVKPGEETEVTLQVKVPAETGEYILEYDLVQEGLVWFSSMGNVTFKKNITVTDDARAMSPENTGEDTIEDTGSENQSTEDQQVPETGETSGGVQGNEESGSLLDLEEDEFESPQSDDTLQDVDDDSAGGAGGGAEYENFKIIFTSDMDGGDFDLFMSDLDGSNLKRLTNNGVDDIYPAVSPDGTKIAFTTTINGLWQIMVMNRDGSDPRQITTGSTLNAYPSWSYDSKYIFYESKIGEDWEIYRIDADGTGEKRLTYNPSGDDWHPACHTSRSYIIYESGPVGHENIMIMDFNGSKRRFITNDGARNRTPDNGGSGETLVFTRYSGGSGQIYTMDTYGNNINAITSMPGRNIHPTLSPDNKYIAFDSDGGGKIQLYIYSFEDGSLRKIINDPGHNYKDPDFLFY